MAISHYGRRRRPVVHITKDRDGKDQKVTLEAGVGKAHLVATADDEDIWAAVAHVREEFLRLYNDWADKHKR